MLRTAVGLAVIAAGFTALNLTLADWFDELYDDRADSDPENEDEDEDDAYDPVWIPGPGRY